MKLYLLTIVIAFSFLISISTIGSTNIAAQINSSKIVDENMNNLNVTTSMSNETMTDQTNATIQSEDGKISQFRR